MQLSAAEARAIALHAQALAAPRGARPNLRALVEQLGAIQIDSVNVLVRSHYLPGFSRLGAYRPELLDKLLDQRRVFEYWGHEASLLPVALQPLFRWRMASAHRWKAVRAFGQNRKQLLADVLAIVRDKGPLGAGELALGKPRKSSGWWAWSEAKVAVEHLFWTGHVTTAGRRGFERLYDLPERVLPAAVLAQPTPTAADAQRGLIERSARALGVATEKDLRDYYRLPLATSRVAIAELVESGALLPVAIDGWPRAYLHKDARPGPIDPARAALLSPFDSLIWHRERTERLFGMAVRLEIYTPAHKRVHGYYVLPFLLGDALVARVDLKADRQARTLLVQASHAEPGMPREAPAALARELAAAASWLGLERVEVVQRGNLARRLRSALRRE